ncbi:MAG: PAS domain S-box protein [Dehalococcoidia bacterium]|nr:PAS domain S-box protein [Dehalococcoidia bacterium]
MRSVTRTVTAPGKYIEIVVGLLILGGLYLTTHYNYLLFHSLTEAFAIVIACSIFMFAWNTRNLSNSNYFTFIGIAYLFIAVVQLLHTLAYKGMPVFPGYDANLPTQLWIAARYIESLSLLAAPLLIDRRLRPIPVFLGYTVVTSLTLASIFYWKIFPDCFIEGTGLTTFKIASEYVISAITLAAIFLLIQKRSRFDARVLRLLIASFAVTIASEMAFTLYTDVYGFMNMLGHFLMVISFYLLYKAVIQTTLTEPYSTLFQDLQQSNERYQALFDGSLDLVYIHDFEGNFIDANNAALNLLGYERQEIPSLNFASLLTDDQIAKSIELLQELKETGIQKEVAEFKLKCKDGNFVYVETQASVIYHEGKTYAIQGVGRDITERQKMQDSLIIADRLSALGNMAGGFAHELNNPLTGVIGYAQLLLDRKDLPEDVRKDLTGIYEEAQRAAEVIKIFTGFALKQPQPKQLVDINSLITDVLKLRQYEQKKANIKVKTKLDPELPLATVGPVRMRQVFMDIIINAEYFMFEAHKKGTLTITTEKSGEVIRASFADDGHGIPPENLGQIFNPFFTTKEVGKGIGLGLSICHSIVTEQKGKIYVNSEHGKGSTFVVELPIDQE